MRRALLLTMLLAGCTKPEAPPPPTPTATPVAVATLDRSELPPAYAEIANDLPESWVKALAFTDMMIVEHEATMEKVTCHCCAKSLAKCYRETLTRASGACPPL